jgi:hypothetical protein
LQTLCFHAWHAEAVSESDKESSRIRKVNIIHYLEDGTTGIVEPAVLNSGLPQRKVLYRHKVRSIQKHFPVGVDYLMLATMQIPRVATAPSATSAIVTLPGDRHTDCLSWQDFQCVTVSVMLQHEMRDITTFLQRWHGTASIWEDLRHIRLQRRHEEMV